MTPFIYLHLATKVYWYKPELSSGISWKEQYRTCAALVSAVYFGKIQRPGDQGKCIPGPTFQGLDVVFPVDNEAMKKKFCANRDSLDLSFMWVVWCELLSSLWFVLFMALKGWKQALTLHLFPYLHLFLYNWKLCWYLIRVRHSASGCETQVCDNSLIYYYSLSKTLLEKTNSTFGDRCELKICVCVFGLPSRAALLTAKRWGFPPADWWQWSSRLRNPLAPDCGEPRTPAETQQHYS